MTNTDPVDIITCCLFFEILILKKVSTVFQGYIFLQCSCLVITNDYLKQIKNDDEKF